MIERIEGMSFSHSMLLKLIHESYLIQISMIWTKDIYSNYNILSFHTKQIIKENKFVEKKTKNQIHVQNISQEQYNPMFLSTLYYHLIVF